jgi:hypothetical protein
MDILAVPSSKFTPLLSELLRERALPTQRRRFQLSLGASIRLVVIPVHNAHRIEMRGESMRKKRNPPQDEKKE